MPAKAPNSTLTDRGVSKTVGFRLDPHHFSLLTKRVQASAKSEGEAARELLIKALTNEQEQNELRARVLAVEGELSELRKDFAVAVEAMLICAGKLTQEQAKTWTQKNLKHA